MTRPREELIHELARDLAPQPRLASARAVAAAWLGACAAFVAVVTLATGPLRPGALAELASRPALALDVLLGAALSGAAILGLARLRVPGLVPGARRARPALVLLAAWLALQLAGVAAAEPVSRLGARHLCWLETLLFALPPLAAALWLARRAAPLERAWTAALAGLAAAALPALAMQLACMHAPLHALVAHLGPMLVLALASAGLGRLALRRV